MNKFKEILKIILISIVGIILLPISIPVSLLFLIFSKKYRAKISKMNKELSKSAKKNL